MSPPLSDLHAISLQIHSVKSVSHSRPTQYTAELFLLESTELVKVEAMKNAASVFHCRGYPLNENRLLLEGVTAAFLGC